MEPRLLTFILSPAAVRYTKHTDARVARVGLSLIQQWPQSGEKGWQTAQAADSARLEARGGSSQSHHHAGRESLRS